MGALALVAGSIGYQVGAAVNLDGFIQTIARGLPRKKQPMFMADLFAHNASYAGAIVGGLVIVFRTWRKRWRLYCEALQSDSVRRPLS
jgi:hypothetical protein